MTAFVITAMATLFLAEPDVAEDSSLKVGPAFQAAMTQPLAATWENVELRRILTRIQETRQTALLLDRRIDPNQELRLEVTNQPLNRFLERLARQVGGQTRILSNTAYIGPETSCDVLRTVVALRHDELNASNDPFTRNLKEKYTTAGNPTWPDLAEPRQILEELAAAVGLELEGLDQIPHDLWAGAHLPESDTIDALSLVLIQFDMTFHWQPNFRGIEIVPLPETITIAREHTILKGSAAQAVKQWSASLPNLDATIKGNRVLVVGTVEQHEAIEALMRPTSATAEPTTPPAVAPLDKRSYTLKIKDLPVKALMAHLEKSGARFTYDADAFAEAGIDFNQRISLDVNQALADEFFKAIFGPLNLDFEIDQVTVKLSLKKQEN